MTPYYVVAKDTTPTLLDLAPGETNSILLLKVGSLSKNPKNNFYLIKIYREICFPFLKIIVATIIKL